MYVPDSSEKIEGKKMKKLFLRAVCSVIAVCTFVSAGASAYAANMPTPSSVLLNDSTVNNAVLPNEDDIMKRYVTPGGKYSVIVTEKEELYIINTSNQGVIYTDKINFYTGTFQVTDKGVIFCSTKDGYCRFRFKDKGIYKYSSYSLKTALNTLNASYVVKEGGETVIYSLNEDSFSPEKIDSYKTSDVTEIRLLGVSDDGKKTLWVSFFNDINNDRNLDEIFYLSNAGKVKSVYETTWTGNPSGHSNFNGDLSFAAITGKWPFCFLLANDKLLRYDFSDRDKDFAVQPFSVFTDQGSIEKSDKNVKCAYVLCSIADDGFLYWADFNGNTELLIDNIYGTPVLINKTVFYRTKDERNVLHAVKFNGKNISEDIVVSDSVDKELFSVIPSDDGKSILYKEAGKNYFQSYTP